MLLSVSVILSYITWKKGVLFNWNLYFNVCLWFNEFVEIKCRLIFNTLKPDLNVATTSAFIFVDTIRKSNVFTYCKVFLVYYSRSISFEKRRYVLLESMFCFDVWIIHVNFQVIRVEIRKCFFPKLSFAFN